MTGASSPGVPTGRVPSAASSPRAWAVLVGITVAGAAIDLYSKHVAFARIAGTPVVVRRADVLALAPADLSPTLIPPHAPVTIVPSVLELRLLLNPGAVFGVGAGKRWFFVVFTMLAAAAAVWMFTRWTTARDRWAHAALGLILAGGVGNLYDRLVFGCVRDFLHPLPGVRLPFGLTWPGGEAEVWPWVSNVADALLLVGIGVLAVMLWRAAPKDHPEAGSAGPGSDSSG